MIVMLKTYEEWNTLGRYVQKGSKARVQGRYNTDGTGSRRASFATFELEQTLPINTDLQAGFNEGEGVCKSDWLGKKLIQNSYEFYSAYLALEGE